MIKFKIVNNNINKVSEVIVEQRLTNFSTMLSSFGFNMHLITLPEFHVTAYNRNHYQRTKSQRQNERQVKQNEILQMISLEPKLAILDETDSGLDIDALRIIAEGINNYRNKDRAFILITHYQRMLNYMKPDFIHVLMDGKIVKSGPKELAHELEEKGYSWV